MIGSMRKLTDGDKLSVRSIHEVFLVLHEMDGFVLRDRSLAYYNDGEMVPATRAAIVTALLLQIGTWPLDKQRDFLATGLQTLNTVLRGDALFVELWKSLAKDVDVPPTTKFKPEHGVDEEKPTSGPKKRKTK